MTQGVSSPQGSWLTPDWDVAPNVRALSTLRGGGLSAQAYASFNLAQHVGDDPEHVRANRALLRAAAKLPSEYSMESTTRVTRMSSRTGFMPPRTSTPSSRLSPSVLALLGSVR